MLVSYLLAGEFQEVPDSEPRASLCKCLGDNRCDSLKSDRRAMGAFIPNVNAGFCQGHCPATREYKAGEVFRPGVCTRDCEIMEGQIPTDERPTNANSINGAG